MELAVRNFAIGPEVNNGLLIDNDALTTTVGYFGVEQLTLVTSASVVATV